MPTSERPSTNSHARTGDDPDFWRQLAYRWFVEYNPLYLLSAALVLGGCTLMLRGLASEESLFATLGVTLLSDVYAFCLLGGAALLTRIGPRRPAVMLALLFALYQWDLTLHTETCAYLGTTGIWAAAAWVAVFAGKIYALAWALRVRFAKRIMVAAIVAAIGLAVGPRVLPELGGRNAGALLAVWCFSLGALGRSSGAIESLVELTPWGHTVLRRAARAAWLLSGALLAGHVLFWSTNHAIALSSALPVVPLVFGRRVRSEARMWAIVLGTLAVVALTLPGAFFITALLAAAALGLRALSPTFRADPEPVTPGEAPAQPYRSSGAPACRPEPAPPFACAPIVGPAEQVRSFAGALFALYLFGWTLDWSGGVWPAHVVGLDAALTVAVLLAAWRLRVRFPLAPLAASYVHLVVQQNLVPAPRSTLEWGATFVALGFVLLAGSLATSYRLRAYPAGARGESGGHRPARAGEV